MKFAFVLFFLLVQIGFSQNQFYGKLLDSKTYEGIPLGHFSYQKNKGFYADKKGRFKVTTQSSKLNVKITALGYQNKHTLLYPDQENIVYLSPKTEQLNEVVLDFVDPAKELIRKIVEAIPTNYPTQEEQLYGVITENAYRDSLYVNPIYKVETKIKVDKISYERKSRAGNIQLLESTIDSINLDSVNIRFYGGAHAAHSDDFVHSRQGPLNLKRIDNYQLKIKDTLEYQGTPVIQLDYKRKKNKGSLFVEENSNAVVKVITETDPKEIDDGDILNRVSRLFSYEAIFYKKDIDQKWRLDSVHHKTAFAWKNKPLFLYLNGQLSVDKHAPQTKPIPQNKRFAYSTVLSDHILTQNSKTEKYKLSAKEKIIAALTKLRSPFGISFHQLSSRSHIVEFYPLSLEIENEQSLKWLAIYIMTLEYKINNRFSIGYSESSSFSKKQYESASLGLNYYQDLSKRDRFYLSSSLNFGHRILSIPQGVYDFKTPFEFGGKRFDSGKLALYSQSRETYFEPSLGFTFQLNPELYLEFKSYYFLPFKTRSGVLAREKNEFWFWNKKKVFDENGIQSTTQAIIQNDFSFGVNLYFRF